MVTAVDAGGDGKTGFRAANHHIIVAAAATTIRIRTECVFDICQLYPAYMLPDELIRTKAERRINAERRSAFEGDSSFSHPDCFVVD